MHRGKKQFYVCFLERGLALALLICGIVLALQDKATDRFLVIGAILSCAYFAALFIMALVRLGLGVGGKIVRHPNNCYVIDHLTSTPAFVCAVMMASNMIIYWAFVRNFSIGYLFIGTVAPILAIIDYTLFAPHEESL